MIKELIKNTIQGLLIIAVLLSIISLLNLDQQKALDKCTTEQCRLQVLKTI